MLEKDVGKILEATLSSSTDYRLQVSVLFLTSVQASLCGDPCAVLVFIPPNPLEGKEKREGGGR